MKKLGQLRGYPLSYPHKLDPKINGAVPCAASMPRAILISYRAENLGPRNKLGPKLGPKSTHKEKSWYSARCHKGGAVMNARDFYAGCQGFCERQRRGVSAHLWQLL